jgi:hypothetical protein
MRPNQQFHIQKSKHAKQFIESVNQHPERWCGIVSMIGGAIIDALLMRDFAAGAYTFVFAIAAIIVAIGWWIGTRLTEAVPANA